MHHKLWSVVLKAHSSRPCASCNAESANATAMNPPKINVPSRSREQTQSRHGVHDHCVCVCVSNVIAPAASDRPAKQAVESETQFLQKLLLEMKLAFSNSSFCRLCEDRPANKQLSPRHSFCSFMSNSSFCRHKPLGLQIAFCLRHPSHLRLGSNVGQPSCIQMPWREWSTQLVIQSLKRSHLFPFFDTVQACNHCT